jgi:hypothetical protein
MGGGAEEVSKHISDCSFDKSKPQVYVRYQFASSMDFDKPYESAPLEDILNDLSYRLRALESDNATLEAQVEALKAAQTTVTAPDKVAGTWTKPPYDHYERALFET